MLISKAPTTSPGKIVKKETDFSSLLYSLATFDTLDPIAAMFLQKNMFSVSARKKKLLLKEGEFCEHVYFIHKGAIRGFIREQGRDITTWITIENELVTSISSLDVHSPSIENIQAIEDCQLFALHYDDLDKLYKLCPSFNVIIRKILQRYYGDAERRAFITRLQNAENKYRYFLKHHDQLANRIPLKYIASFLGITIETLSRVRKKISMADAPV